MAVESIINKNIVLSGTKKSAAAMKGINVIREHCINLTDRPGIYRMLGEDNKLLYIGKAKNLKKRVYNYTNLEGHTYRIQRMISLVRDMQFIETETEVDALLLEITLIKKFKPKFNILMRDDKSFPYIVFTNHPEAPRLMSHRISKNNVQNKKNISKKNIAMSFGPFASSLAVRNTIEILQKSFHIRICSDNVYSNRSRPCILYQIKKCSAPCTGEIGKEEYYQNINEAKKFLRGRGQDALKIIREKMNFASKQMQYEKAAVLRDQLQSLTKIFEHRGFHPKKFPEADLFAIVRKNNFFCVQIFFFRSYQNWGNKSFIVKLDKEQEEHNILNNYVGQFYQSQKPPKLILLSKQIQDQNLFEKLFAKKYQTKINIKTPIRGEKKYLVRLALQNAQSTLTQHYAQQNRWQELLDAFIEYFKIEKPPQRIEIYDNSHIQGTSAIGAMVVAGKDGFEKKYYRKYNIKMKSMNAGGDDYGMLKEVLSRRFAKKPTLDLNSDFLEHLPDILIIDGGVGHLNIAGEILRKLQINIPLVFAIAKGKERNKGNEKIYQLDKGQINIANNHPCVYFFQILRDEAHRFAINVHRQKRKKTIYDSSLSEINGIGKKRRKLLLDHFGSIQSLKQASIVELQSIKGVSRNMAENIYQLWN